MNYHRLSQGAEWAVLAAVVVLHCLIVAPVRSANDAAWLHSAADAQPVAAIILILAWGILGPGWLWCRAVAILLLLFVLGTQGSDGYGPFVPAPAPLTLPLSVAIAATVGLISMRFVGLRATSIRTGRQEGPPQFSIRSLLLTTTLIATAIACLELLRSTVLFVSPELEDDQLVRWLLENRAATARQCVLSVAVAGCAVAALVIVLRPGSAWLRLAALAVGIPTIGVYLTHLVGETTDSFAVRAVELTAALAGPAVLVAITVLPLRLMGFRLMRPQCCPVIQGGSMVPIEQRMPCDVNEPIMSDGDHRTTLKTTLPEACR